MGEDLERIGGIGGLLDLCGAELDLGVCHVEGELIDAGLDGVPAIKRLISGMIDIKVCGLLTL